MKKFLFASFFVSVITFLCANTDNLTSFQEGSIIINNNDLHPLNQINAHSDISTFAPLWADDLLVTNECNISPFLTTLAFDYDANGNMYVAILSRHLDNDTLWIYRSTDRGYTWTRGWEATHTNWNILMYDMKVQHYGSNPWIYTLMLVDNGTDTTMYFRRYDMNQTLYSWFTFYPTDPAYQNIFRVSMDITDEINPHIYIAYVRDTGSNDDIYRLVSSDNGNSWTISTAFVGHADYPDVSAGPGTYFYIVYYITDLKVIRLHRYKDYGTFDGYSDISPSGGNNLYHPVVASARQHAYPGNVVYVVYQDGLTSLASTRCRISTSLDGGQNWTIDELFPTIGPVHAVRPFVAFSWNGNDEAVGLCTKHYNGADTLIYIFNPSHGGSWSESGVVNQYRTTTSITPQGMYISSGLGNGISVVYREYSSDNIWYDRSTHQNSVEEIISTPFDNVNITINSNNLLFSVSLTKETFGKIEIFDLSGRSVKTVFSGLLQKGENNFSLDIKNISIGSYILYVSTPYNTVCGKFSILR